MLLPRLASGVGSCCRQLRRCYSGLSGGGGGLRHADLRWNLSSGEGGSAGQLGQKTTPDKLATGRLARWSDSPRITEGWDMSREHKGDLLRAIMMGLASRPLSEPGERTLRRRYDQIRRVQAYNETLVAELGIDLAAARCLIGVGCRVAFAGASGEWVALPGASANSSSSSSSSLMPVLPRRPTPGFEVEAIDARDALIMTDAADWLGRLRSLRFLRLRRAPFVDDQLLARLAARCDGLEILDVSSCPGITWEGISTLWRLSSLRRLILSENPHLLSPEAAHTCVPTQLETLLPGLFVEGADDPCRVAVERADPAEESGIYAV